MRACHAGRAARAHGSSMRLPMKPKHERARTAFLRSRLPSAIAVAIAASEVASARTFSRSGITLAGEKLSLAS